jgi:hypothetical protein
VKNLSKISPNRLITLLSFLSASFLLVSIFLSLFSSASIAFTLVFSASLKSLLKFTKYFILFYIGLDLFSTLAINY